MKKSGYKTKDCVYTSPVILTRRIKQCSANQRLWPILSIVYKSVGKQVLLYANDAFVIKLTQTATVKGSSHLAQFKTKEFQIGIG